MDLLDPALIVVGGGLVVAGDVLLEPIREQFRSLVLAADHRPTKGDTVTSVNPIEVVAQIVLVADEIGGIRYDDCE